MELKNVLGGLVIVIGGIGTFTHAVLSHGENDISHQMVNRYPIPSVILGLVGGYLAMLGDDYTTLEKVSVGIGVAIVATALTPLVAIGVWDLSTDGDAQELQSIINDEQMEQLTFYEKVQFVEDDMENIVLQTE